MRKPASSIIVLFFCLILPGMLSEACAQSSSGTGERIYFDTTSGQGAFSGNLSTSQGDGGFTPIAPAAITVPPAVQSIRTSGRITNRVDLVFLGDGYTRDELPAYAQKVTELNSSLFSETPLSQYRNYFNVHKLSVVSDQSGIDHALYFPDFRSTALEMEFYCHETPDSMCVDVTLANDYAAYAPDADQIIVLANSARDAGAAYPFSDMALVSANGAHASQNLLHQLGHSFANLADETDSGSWPDYTGFEPAEPNASMLSAAEMTAQHMKWYRWLGYNGGASFGGVNGSFEGAMGSARQIYRPTSTSKMRSVDQPFNNPSVESFIIETYKFVRPIDDSTPTGSGYTGQTTLFVTPMQPSDHDLDVQWYVGGVAIAGATAKTFRPDDYPLSNGIRQVSVRVVDNTPLVRDETARAQYLTESRSWSVTIDQHAPTIVTQPMSTSKYRGEFARFTVDAGGVDLRYQWYRNNAPIADAAARVLTVPVQTMSQSGDRFHVVVSNVGGQIVSSVATLTVLNHAPVIQSVEGADLFRNDAQEFLIRGTDADGDTLQYSVTALPSAVAAGISPAIVGGSKLRLSTGNDFTGTFQVLVTVNDGIDSTNFTFDGRVINRAPVIQPIADVSQHRLVHGGEIAFTATDADHDSLTPSLVVDRGNGSGPLSVAIEGSKIVYDNTAFFGSADITLTVSDGRSTASESFTLTIYDHVPVLDKIEDQGIHWNQGGRLEVPVSAHDEDAEPITVTAVVEPWGNAYAADQYYRYEKPSDGWKENILGASERHFEGKDHATGALVRYFILPNGEIHEFRETLARSPLVNQFPKYYYDDPTLLIEPANPATSSQVTASMVNGKIVLTAEPSFRGTVQVRVNVADSVQQDVRLFLFTVYDAKPFVRHIPVSRLHWREDKKSVTVDITDSDAHPEGLSPALEVQTYDTSLAYALDQQYDFTNQEDQSALANSAGFGEKYLVTRGNVGPKYAIFPTGELFTFTTNILSRTLLAQLPPVYYEDVNLLSDVPPPSATAPYTPSFSQNILTFDPPARYRGKTLAKVVLTNGDFRDEQVVLCDVYNNEPHFSEQMFQQARVQYRNGFPSLLLSSTDKDSTDLPFHKFSAKFGSYADGEVPALVAAFELHPDPAHYRQNELGWNEKHLTGKNFGGVTDYFILPTGELFRFAGSVETSERIATLPREYYLEPTALNRPAVDTSSLVPYRVWTEGGILYLDRPAGNAGIALVALYVTDGLDTDTTIINLEMLNTPPDVDVIPDQKLHWREETRNVTIVATDREQDPLRFTMIDDDRSAAFNLDQQHNFSLPTEGIRVNLEGQQEKYIRGNKNLSGAGSYYFILPTGALYEYSRSVPLSTRIGTLSPRYYDHPELLFDVPPPSYQPITYSITGNQIAIRQKDLGWTGSVIANLEVSDGIAAVRRSFVVTIYNNAPVITPVEPQDIGRLTRSVTVGLAATDKDLEPLVYSAKLGTAAHLARELDQLYNFSLPNGAPEINKDGWREVAFLGTENGESKRFAILPGATLYQWNGSIRDSRFVAQLTNAYYTNPALLIDVAVQPALPAVTVSVVGQQLRVGLPEGYRGTFPVTAFVSDGNLSDSTQISFSQSNHAPTINPISSQSMHWRTDSIEVTPVTRDYDSDPLTLAARLSDTSIPYSLDQANDFFIPKDGVVFNQEGLNEKLFQGTKNIPNRYFWFAILPNGDLYEYTYSIARSVHIATLPKDYYNDVNLLVNVAPSSFTPAAISVTGGKITIDPITRWTGTFIVEASISDGELSATTTFPVTVFNTYPELARVDNVQVSRRVSQAQVSLQPSDRDSADVSNLSHLARVGSMAQVASELKAQYLFTAENSTYAYNSLGWREKHLRGTSGGSARRYFILPSGEIRERSAVSPDNVLLSTLVGRLSRSYYENPLLLLNAGAPTSGLPTAQFSFVGNTLTAVTATGYQGAVPVLLQTSDGNDYDFEEFVINVGNIAPVLLPVAGQTMHWRTDYLDVRFSASDADADPLTCSARVISAGNPPVTFSCANGVLRVNPGERFVGRFDVTLTVTDGLAADSKSFTVYVENKKPVLTGAADVVAAYRQSSILTSVAATDGDGDPLTWSAQVVSGPANSSAQVVTDAVRTLIPDRFVGDIYVAVTVTDGAEAASKTFWVSVKNKAPVVGAISNRSIHWRESSVTVPVSASDGDGNPLTLSAQVSGNISATAAVSGSVVTVNLPSHNLGSVQVTVSASDGNLVGTTTFTVNVVNQAPKFPRIETQYVPLGERDLSIDITAVDPDNDPLTYTAELIVPERMAYELDQRHDFELRFGDFFYNLLGNREKYIQGTKHETDGLYWYVIYPNGDFWEWREQLSDSFYYGRLPIQFYDDPTRLFNVAEPSAAAAPATIQLNGATLDVHLNQGFVGQFMIRATTTDTKATDTFEYVVEVFDPESGLDDDPLGETCEVESEVHHGECPNSNARSSFTAEGRIGDSADGPGGRTCEGNISRSAAGPFGPTESQNHVWRSGENVPFSLVYDSSRQRATWTIGGTTSTHNVTIQSPLTDLLIRARCSHSSSSVELSELLLNGSPINADVASGSSHGSTNVLQVVSGNLNAGFTLTGKARLSFANDSSHHSSSSSNSGSDHEDGDDDHDDDDDDDDNDDSHHTPRDSEISFQIAAVSIEGHRSDCSPGNERKVTICHLPPGNTSNPQTIRISRSALSAHLDHGDVIGECPGESMSQIDSCDSGLKLESPIYAQWNTVMSMRNTLELVNRGDQPVTVNLSMYSILGVAAGESTANVPAHGQMQIAIEQLPGYVANSQGLIRLAFAGSIDGQMLYSRKKPTGNVYEFQFAIPLTEGLFGKSSVAFNTTQPSTVSAEKRNAVMNWLSITNLDATQKQFVIQSYNRSGRLLQQRTVDVAARTRANLDGGHDLAGKNNAGIHVITPVDIDTNYFAELSRFGGNSPKGLMASEYRFGVNHSAQLSQSDPQFVALTRESGEMSWLEVANTTDRKTRVAINLFNDQGKLIESVDAKLAPFATTVISAARFLKVGESGHAQVIPFDSRSVIAQGFVYYLSGKTEGSVVAAYGAPSRRASSCLLTGGYNIQGGVENNLLISNTTDSTISAVVTLISPTQVGERVVTLKRKTAVSIPIQNPRSLLAPANSAGTITVRSRQAGAGLFSQIVRVRKDSRKLADYTAYTPIR